MQVSITGRHLEVSSALKSHLVSKLAHLEGMFPRVKKVQAIVGVEKYRHTAEIHFHAGHAEFSARKTTKDMYASIDAAVKALEQQALKSKGKSAARKTRPSGASEA
jgi:putative sigma-54 modulation protein